MIRIRQIKLSINSSMSELIEICAKKLKVSKNEIKTIKIKKQSLDARKKPNLFFVYEVDVEVKNEELTLKHSKSNDILIAPNETYHFNITGKEKLSKRPIIIGSGPAGLFCGYILAENGYKPIIIERGEKVENRIKTVEEFWKTGKLNTESNVQFGEGGAGTFSDGKLVTQVKDNCFRNQKVLKMFVEAGADEDILYIKKPHIGTDQLREVVKNIREKIINMGGEFQYNSRLNDIKIENNTLKSIKINNNWIDTNVLVLAIGHSARDTFEMLYKNNIQMMPKPFAVGIRIQHDQSIINKSQYGIENHPKLGSASYKLTYKAKSGRGVYSFCMCPGGFVVNSSSEERKLAINGMSNHKRDSGNANSAIIVTITEKDYGTHPLDGIKFQRELEEKAFKLGKGNIPIQLFIDYKSNTSSNSFQTITPKFKGNYQFSNLNEIFPEYINNDLKESIEEFDKKIKGFASNDSILAAVESRTSSPVRIIRNETLESNIKGIFPCGEGAGYAGGITSAAMDGIKVAEAIASIYKNN